MSRDYKSHKSSKAKTGGSSLIWGIFIGYTLGLISAIGIWMYLSQVSSPYLLKGKSMIEPLTRNDGINELKLELKELSSTTEIAKKIEDKPKFDFYSILPGIDSVAMIESIAGPKNRQIVESTTNNPGEYYFLQAGSFRNIDEAEDLKARLALLGMIAAVKPVNVLDSGRWYRVRIGPFTKMVEIDQTRSVLSQNGIEFSLIKLNNRL